jgi:hypothetical protein
LWSWSLPQKLHKRKKKIRFFRRFFAPLLKKNYSFSIKMSTRFKRLSFEMLYYRAKSKNAEYRKRGDRGAVNTSQSAVAS